MSKNHKTNREGKALVLEPEQVVDILIESKPKYKLLFAICYFTSCRISEALTLNVLDIGNKYITFRAQNTKTNDFRQVRIHPELQQLIDEYEQPESGFLFPSKTKQGHIIRQTADRELRRICGILGIVGASTHSFRRTGISHLFNAGEELKTIQGYTGHKSLAVLNGYVQVKQSKIDNAVLKLTLKGI